MKKKEMVDGFKGSVEQIEEMMREFHRNKPILIAIPRSKKGLLKEIFKRPEE